MIHCLSCSLQKLELCMWKKGHISCWHQSVWVGSHLYSSTVICVCTYMYEENSCFKFSSFVCLNKAWFIIIHNNHINFIDKADDEKMCFTKITKLVCSKKIINVNIASENSKHVFILRLKKKIVYLRKSNKSTIFKEREKCRHLIKNSKLPASDMIKVPLSQQNSETSLTMPSLQ